MFPNNLSRRELLQLIGYSASALAFTPYRSLASLTGRPKITIVGAGIAGVSLAWILDPICDVTLIEKRDVIGGHADSRQVVIGNEKHTVDMGAQFISGITHPNYMKLLQAIGFHNPNNPVSDLMVQSKMTMTFLRDRMQNPLFVSPVFNDRLWPLFKTWNRAGISSFARFRKAARNYEISSREDITVKEWVDNLSLSQSHKKSIALGLISAMNGCSLEDASTFSLREGMAFVSRTLPSNPLRSIYYFNCKKGLGGVIDELVSQCKNLNVLTSQNIINFAVSFNAQRITTTHAVVDSDFIIFACPPHASSEIISKLPGSIPLVKNLEQFNYFQSKIALHRDPIYMHQRKKYWSIYNTRIENGYCGASICYSRLLRTRENFFKSWVTGRHQPPRVAVYEREFLHPKIDLDFVRAQRSLEQHQGNERIWFAGSYTRDVDSQDTASP